MNARESLSELFLSFFKRPENLTNIIAVITTVILGYRSLRTGDVNNYLQAVLAVLAVLAFGQLAVGYSSILRDREIGQLSESLGSLRSERLSADLFFRTRKELPQLETLLSSATTSVDALGLSLAAIALTHTGTLRNLAKSGVHFRLIVSNPDNEAIQEAIAMRILEVESADTLARLVRMVIENLKMCDAQIEGGNIQVRVTDHVPSFSYLGIDTAQPEGRINVELYLTKVPLGRNPIALLSPMKDPHWYTEFRDQFEFFWSQASETSIGQRD
jgi:hypothetical protein